MEECNQEVNKLANQSELPLSECELNAPRLDRKRFAKTVDRYLVTKYASIYVVHDQRSGTTEERPRMLDQPRQNTVPTNFLAIEQE